MGSSSVVVAVSLDHGSGTDDAVFDSRADRACGDFEHPPRGEPCDGPGECPAFGCSRGSANSRSDKPSGGRSLFAFSAIVVLLPRDPMVGDRASDLGGDTFCSLLVSGLCVAWS